MLPSESYFWSLWRAGSGSRGPFGLDKGMSLGARIRWHSGKETIFRPELASQIVEGTSEFGGVSSVVRSIVQGYRKG